MDTIIKAMQPSAQGLFLSLEGIEGCGKTTQILKLKTYLESLGHEVLCLREPGGTDLGEKLRQAILGQTAPLHPLAEAHLFASSRAQLLSEVIVPFLQAHTPEHPRTVLCDRFLDSSLVYQGVARQLGFKTVLEIHGHGILRTVPHKTFYLAIDVQTSLARQKARGQNKDYFEKENLDFYEMLFQGHEALLEIFPDRLKRIDASGSPDEVFNFLKTELHKILNHE